MTVYETLTNKMIERIEKNQSLPWTKPWKKTIDGNTSVNFVTGNAYHGFYNQAMTSGYENPLFASFKQAQKIGFKIKKGSKGIPIIYWTMLDKKNDDDETLKTIPMLRYYTVFNIEDMEGDKDKYLDRYSFEPIQMQCVTAEKLVSNYLIGENISRNSGVKACYSSNDSITIPPFNAFRLESGYFGTLFHEIAHSTGHEKRLNRDMGNTFGSKAYGNEELIAELTSVYLCNTYGVLDNEEELNSAAYIKNWINAIKADPKILIQTMSKAKKAYDYIIEYADETEIKQAM